MFRTLLLLGMIIFCVGCSTTGPQIEPTDHFNAIEPMEGPAIVVETLPKVNAIVVHKDGVDYPAFTLSEFDKLREYKAKSEKNTEVLRQIIDINKSLIVERNLLLEAAKAEERRANNIERDYLRTEEKLRHVETMNMIETNIQRLLIIGLVLGM